MATSYGDAGFKLHPLLNGEHLLDVFKTPCVQFTDFKLKPVDYLPANRTKMNVSRRKPSIFTQRIMSFIINTNENK